MTRKSSPSDSAAVAHNMPLRIPSGPKVDRNRLMPGLRFGMTGGPMSGPAGFLMRSPIPAVSAMRLWWQASPMWRFTG